MISQEYITKNQVELILKHKLLNDSIFLKNISEVLSKRRSNQWKFNRTEYKNIIRKGIYTKLNQQLQFNELDKLLRMEEPLFSIHTFKDEVSEFTLVVIEEDTFSSRYIYLIYICQNILCKICAYPDQKLLEIWVLKYIKNGKLTDDIKTIDSDFIKNRISTFLNRYSLYKYTFKGFNRPMLLASNEILKIDYS